jgi:hypothetical protein
MSKLKRANRNLTLLLSIAAWSVGCGGPFDASLSGTVTIDGTPLPTGTVALKPMGDSGASASASIDSSGSFTAMTGREYGLPSGDYAVTVVAFERPTALYGKDGGPPPPGKRLSPEWYGSADTSGLTITVEPGSNTHNFELTSTPPAGWVDPSKQRRRR